MNQSEILTRSAFAFAARALLLYRLQLELSIAIMLFVWKNSWILDLDLMN